MEMKMQHSNHYNFNLPEADDNVEIGKLNENFETIDAELYAASQTADGAKDVTDALTDPEYVGTRPTINVKDVNVEDTAFFSAGASAVFTPSAALEVQTANPATAGKIMAADANNKVKQSDLDVAVVASGVTAGNSAKGVTDALTDPEYVGTRPTINVKDVNVEDTAFFSAGASAVFTPSAALEMRTAVPASEGNIMVRDENNHVRPSGVGVKDVDDMVNSRCTSFYTTYGTSTTIKQGRPCMWSPNQISYTSNVNLSGGFVGVALSDPVDGKLRIATNGECKVLVYKNPNLAYNTTFGLTGTEYSAVNETGGFQPATSNSDLGGFTANTKRPKIFLLNYPEYTAMEDGSWALLDAVICTA